MGSIRPGRIISPVNANKLANSLAILIFAFGFVSCSTTEKPKPETAPTSVAQTEEVQPSAPVAPPEHKEVTEAVSRVFKDTVEIDSRRKPFFIDGDFNGDNSRDLAVIIIPAPNKLAELNQEIPNWILKDPLSGDEPRIPRLRVAANETLLAVIHGYGPNGWRDAQATQTFLLKNVVGSGMTAGQAKDLTRKAKKTPDLRGDVIGQVVDGNAGYLYFAGATYSWYDPRTFQEETDTRLAHTGANRKK